MSVSDAEFAALQSQVRRQRRWNFALGVAVIVSGLMAATSAPRIPDVIQAKKFEVVNDRGRVLVAIGSTRDCGTISTMDGSGNTLVAVDSLGLGSGRPKGYVETFGYGGGRTGQLPEGLPK